MLFIAGIAQTNGVNPAGGVGGEGEVEVRLPSGVVEIVLVKVDGAVVLGFVPPVVVLTGPGVTGDGAGGKIDGAPVEPVWRAVDDVMGVDSGAEVPCADDVGLEIGGRFGRVKCGPPKPRVFQLAVEMPGMGFRVGPCRQEQGQALVIWTHIESCAGHCGWVRVRPRRQRGLLNPGDTGLRIEARANQIPFPGDQWLVTAAAQRLAVSENQARATALVEIKRKSSLLGFAPTAD